MATNGGARAEDLENRPIGSSSSSSHTRSKRMDPILVASKCFGVVTTLAAILCIFVNVLTAVRSCKHLSDVFEVVFRCYAVLLGLFVIIAETEWNFVFKYMRILEYWVARGVLQIFFAIMTIAYPGVNRNREDIYLLQKISSYILLACGLLYLIAGLFCLGFLKRARQAKDISRIQAEKDLEEVERRRAELQGLLIIEDGSRADQ